MTSVTRSIVQIQEAAYPKLMILTGGDQDEIGTVVLMTKEPTTRDKSAIIDGVGVVVCNDLVDHRKAYYRIGYQCDTWQMDDFVDFHGVVTIAT